MSPPLQASLKVERPSEAQMINKWKSADEPNPEASQASNTDGMENSKKCYSNNLMWNK